MGNFKDLTGQTFGQLTVIERAENREYPNGGKEAQWLCKCSCGNQCIRLGRTLHRGTSTSCGCLKKQRIRDKALIRGQNKKLNRYTFDGEVGTCYSNTSDRFFIFDVDDYDKIKDYTWCIKKTGYVRAETYNYGISEIQVHRLIMDCPDDMVIDHINRKPWDNRKCNLRICTIQQNNINRRFDKRPSNTGVMGVTLRKWGKYEVAISVNGKRKYLGLYKTLEEAKQVRLDAEKKYWGEFKPKNNERSECDERY